MQDRSSVKLEEFDFNAAILDLDGVITRTSNVHAMAWKKLFDTYLQHLSEEGRADFKPFDIEQDYLLYIDGKPRLDGVRSFLNSRDIHLPEGSRADPPGAESVHGLASLKNQFFRDLLSKKKPEVFEDSLRAIQKWKSQGKKLAVVSSSKNCETILESVGLKDFFDIRVDGNLLEEKNLHGKPEPDLFLYAAQGLGVEPEKTIVIEDAVSGVQAGRNGNFGEVIGLAREGDVGRLVNAGADVVVKTMDDLIESASERKLSASTTWVLRYTDFKPEEEKVRESLCALGNGIFVTRGSAEEAWSDRAHYPGTYLAGGYNRLKTDVMGNTIESEDLVNWPNWTYLSFKPEGGTWLDIHSMTLLHFSQDLDLKCGVLTRSLKVCDHQGRQSRLVSRRFVSMDDPHLAAIEWELTPLNWSGHIVIRSGLDASVINSGVERYKELNCRHLNVNNMGRMQLHQSMNDHHTSSSLGEPALFLDVSTNQSHIRMVQMARTRIHGLDQIKSQVLKISRNTHGRPEPNAVVQEMAFEAQQGEAIHLEKVVSIFTSKDHAISEPLEAARESLIRADSFEGLLERHRLKWKHLWSRADIELKDNPYEQLVLRLHIFHLLQTFSMNSVDRDVGAPARGWHGEAYRGHIFWDELFVFPFFNFRFPELSRELLEYRYRRLDEARARARAQGFVGAMYPWQSGSSGREESPMIHINPVSGRWIPDNTHLQRHVSSAIAYNIWQYFQVTQDRDFMSGYGAEMMLEIARFWASIAEFNPGRKRYDINRVVGPDEFHTKYPGGVQVGINNNAYTNVVASWCIQKAIEVLGNLDERRKQELVETLKLTDRELQEWDHVSRELFVPFCDGGIISQFEGYQNLRDLNLEEYRHKYGDIQRLDRILEFEGSSTDEFRAGKQADVLMLFFLFSSEELEAMFRHLGYEFHSDWIPKNIHYYLTYTSHGSTLSRAVHAWVLARSDRERSWSLFHDALESDISDIQNGTTGEGIHLGAMGETVDLVQRGYTGIVVRDDVIWFNPQLPEELPAVYQKIRFRGHWISIWITRSTLRLKVDRSWYEVIKVGFKGDVHSMRQGEEKEFSLREGN